ncbi:MAG TPA: shikimate dehydrogenase [Clostridium sp.]|nr:shikimate dehydrogenase [Clostridiales bacterium]HBC95296.1 shikimate dehydrogenase [Clostridium sp.]
MSNFYGLIGKTLAHSFSPTIHHLIFKSMGKSGEYNLFEIEEKNLDRCLESLKILGCRGVNVTIPYKVEIMKYIDDISCEAGNIGAVNTVEFSGDKLIGHNTDYYGFGLTLKRYGIEVHNKSIVLLGTGGVSKAAARYVLDRGAGSMTYVSRDPGKFRGNKFKVIGYDDLCRMKKKDIIINCTPCGMYPDVDSSPVDKKILDKFDTAVDLIYNPRNTLFLRLADELGLYTVSGLYMLIAQAAASQQIWQREKISLKAVDELYDEFLNIHKDKGNM